MSSPSLAAQLVEDDLVEEYRLMIEPILVGGGKTSEGRSGDQPGPALPASMGSCGYRVPPAATRL
ncbi:MAG: hypothetical protein QOI36_2694 [Pseudonocardiales bacterium]|jgi:riboflavin biosynthesis pyrimidine reductase|nr:RibD C-terminal domain [Pseudonocardia sp.]MDT7651288.1 hypothetical protein [Pseudonocardiales bacterium]